eukprot:scaffold247168_cov61-Attheya_sp.AAC.1
MALRAIDLIIEHGPSFSIGHNVYGYDNRALALSLRRGHKYTRYFRSVTKSATMSAPSMGLIMCIPGINNLDTYMFISSSMYTRFKQFSLDALCKALKLTNQKTDIASANFDLDLFTNAPGVALEVVTYNIQDCRATLSLCENLDLINQVVGLCYCSRAWGEDVMLYNTGAMATSCLCYRASLNNCVYNWTRCDWKPEEFEGGEVLFRKPLIAKFIMIVDFVSMYPSIIASSGISPESVDSRDLNTSSKHRFTTVTIYAHVHVINPASYVLISMMGSDDECNTDPTLQCIIAEKCCPKAEAHDAQYYIDLLYHKVCNEDPLINKCKTKVVNMTTEEMQLNTTSLGHIRCSIMCRHLKDGGTENEWYWKSHRPISNGCLVDWTKTVDGHTTVVQGK